MKMKEIIHKHALSITTLERFFNSAGQIVYNTINERNKQEIILLWH